MTEVCAVCHQEVGQYDHKVNNNNETFHSNCFVCCTCQEKLAGKPFFNINGKRVCKPCYTDKYAHTCDACGAKIVGESISTGEKKNYHPECFKCNKCGKPITSSYRIVDGGKVEHSHNCMDGQTSKPRHEQCRDCGHLLVGVKYFILEDGKKVCGECFKANHSTTCYKCHKPILQGQSHIVKDWKYHKDCFVCKNCGEYMGSKRLKIEGGNVVCFDCTGKAASPSQKSGSPRDGSPKGSVKQTTTVTKTQQQPGSEPQTQKHTTTNYYQQ